MDNPSAVPPEQDGKTIAAVLKLRMPDKSWKQVRQLLEQRLVEIDGSPCMDPARRVKAGDSIEMLTKPPPVFKGGTLESLNIRYLDHDFVVVEKVSGINTVRHPLEKDWKDGRREMAPTLEDLTRFAIAERTGKKRHDTPRLRIVQRLDKLTSGLVVFARSHEGEKFLGQQFRYHTVLRKYIAIVHGHLEPRSIRSWLTRDRGDGLRGSAATPGVGKEAITHVSLEETIGEYSVLGCRLETGRTHQIRIHLSEAGFPVCGEPVYTFSTAGRRLSDDSHAPRLALHAAELGFQKPDGTMVSWTMDLPLDLKGFVQSLRNAAAKKVP